MSRCVVGVIPGGWLLQKWSLCCVDETCTIEKLNDFEGIPGLRIMR